MSEVLELLELRQGEKSDEQFANEIGLRGATLWRYKNGKSEINTVARKKMIEYFCGLNDAVMIGALLTYKSGKSLSPQQLEEIGRFFLAPQSQSKLTLVPAA